MFNFFKKKEIPEPEQPKPIGVAVFATYTSCMGLGTTYFHPSQNTGGPGFCAKDFFPFYEIEDHIEDNVKVNGAWFKRSEIFLFKGHTSNELVIFQRKMEKKFGPLKKWTDIHQLYDNGLTVSCDIIGTAVNHFHDKKLEKKIHSDMEDLINKTRRCPRRYLTT